MKSLMMVFEKRSSYGIGMSLRFWAILAWARAPATQSDRVKTESEVYMAEVCVCFVMVFNEQPSYTSGLLLRFGPL